MGVHERIDPAERVAGPKPTDRDLPREERTRAGPFLFAIAVLMGLGILLALGSVIKFAETTETIANQPEAVSPTENLGGGRSDEAGDVVDRDTQQAANPNSTESASPAVPGEADQ